MSNCAPVPRLWVQVMARVEPIPQVTAVLGAVRTVVGATMSKAPLLFDTAELLDHLTRMRAVAVTGPGTSQL